MELLTVLLFVATIIVMGWLIVKLVDLAWKLWYKLIMRDVQERTGPQAVFTPPQPFLPIPEPSDGEAAQPNEIANSEAYQAWLTQATQQNNYRPTHQPRHTK